MADAPPPAPPPGEPAMAPATTAPKAAPAAVPPPKPQSQGNPAFRAMGLPNWKLKLPSRNWLIFIGIVSTWTGTLVYDRRQKKKAQQKWCTLVSHIAKEPLQTNTLARRVTVYLAAPPGDSLRTTREHFVEYVKPVLVAAALDWDVVEGRREGEVRVGTADRIRRFRRRHGESGEEPEAEATIFALEQCRDRIGVREWEGQKGDIVIGRHTWKEYVRGVHEGWLGPLDAPRPPPAVDAVATTATSDDAVSAPTSSPPTSETPSIPDTPSVLETPLTPDPDNASPTTSDPEKKPTEEPPAPPPKPLVRLPYNTPTSYPNSHLPASIPTELTASNAIPFPHILGFMNTPIRIYRFLTRRYIADDVGRQTAAIVLATYRPYRSSTSALSSSDPSDLPPSEPSPTPLDDGTVRSSSNETWEQQKLLHNEETSWTKAARARTDGEGEHVWLDDVVVDARIGARMRRFELLAEDEERAKRIGKGIAGIPGRRAGDVKGEEEVA